MKKGEKKRVRAWLWNSLIVICVAVMMISGYQLYGIYREYRQGEEAYEELASFVGEWKGEPVKTEIAATESSQPDMTKTAAEEETSFDPVVYAQWFGKLKEVNPDIVGWIRIEGTAIDYPVMYSGDNAYYLYRTYQGTQNGSGSIFMEGANRPDFSDLHTILYGHNMKNGSMFAGLHKYAKETFYRDHPIIELNTEEGPRRYQIFSCHTSNAYDKLYDISYVAGESCDAFVSCLKSLSDYETGVDVSGQDLVLTLSTCKGNGDLRYVVHAKLVK